MNRPIASLTLALVVLSPSLATAQRIDWHTRAILYGDNTEFFTDYRTGETILGGQVKSWLQASDGKRLSLRVGLFADRRWGSNEFTDSLKPLLSARYRTRHSMGVFGSLETIRRHGLIDPLMVSTRELTTPVEYGLQWLERRKWLHADAWINWQRLNTPQQREAFELGAVVAAIPVEHVALKLQHLWSHHGGQLYDAGVPVSNNRVTALGVDLSDSLPLVRKGGITAWRVWSEGHLDPDYPADRPAGGSGTLVRARIEPWRHWTFFVMRWWGRDFVAAAGDANYGSVGKRPGVYKSERSYWQFGVLRRVGVASNGASFDTELRFHRIDNEPSEAFFNTGLELSYRLVVRVPIDVVVRR